MTDFQARQKPQDDAGRFSKQDFKKNVTLL
jgi:hypothetical protein